MATFFTDDHEWAKVEGDTATIGITAYAAEQLGDVVYVELPEVGKTFAVKDEVATVESVKAASEIYAPLSGEIVEVNGALADTPELVNESPEGEGWFFKIKLSNAGETASLKDEAAYKDYVAGLE